MAGVQVMMPSEELGASTATPVLGEDQDRSNAIRMRRLALVPFQARAVSALAENIGRVHARIARATPHERAGIGREIGTSLLAAPTGSGKTLVLGRVLETLVPDPVVPAAGFRGTVWFWFAPYSGLVEQTKLVLRAECPGLRLRELSRDREPSLTRDGDVFVSTWGSVAANNREARTLRRSGERSLSVDDLIATLRDDGYFIGCVIDEAHLNFGTTAKAAAAFFLDHIAPDATLLATATPRDAKLDAFLRAAGMGEPNRVEVPRAAVVEAALNKRGLVAAYLSLTGEQRSALDADATIIHAAWRHHEVVKERLAEHEVAVTPLLLVQVPNDSVGTDEVDLAKQALLAAGADENSIRVHTSGQPDPEFHSLSNDEDVEVLIFKLAAATGFDAPRAFSLVSLRPVMTPEFGLQVIGRVMRVDPRVRASASALRDPLLSRGTVFLAAPDRQNGLQTAADLLAAFRATVAPVTPQLSLILAEDIRVAEVGFAPLGGSIDPSSASEVRSFTDSETISPSAPGTSARSFANALASMISQQAQQADLNDDDLPLSLFGNSEAAPESAVRHPRTPAGSVAYALRQGIGVPDRLMREKPPEPSRLADLATEAALLFNIDERVIALLLTPLTVDVILKRRELLLGAQAERTERFAAVPSPAKLAESAQRTFSFHEDIDARLFRRKLVERFRSELRSRSAFPRPDTDLARVIDSIAVFQPERIRDALNRAMAAHVEPVAGEPVPQLHWDIEGLHEAKRAVYGVFPSGMNGPERRFAEWLDEANGVTWWMRNPSNPHNRWAVRLVLSNGAGFHPDFIVGVVGRRALDGVRLVEIKDDGETGRLHSDENRRKVQARHASYFDVLFVAEEDEGAFQRLRFSDDANRIVPRGRLVSSDLRD
jgi:hypothetical protein